MEDGAGLEDIKRLGSILLANAEVFLETREKKGEEAVEFEGEGLAVRRRTKLGWTRSISHEWLAGNNNHSLSSSSEISPI